MIDLCIVNYNTRSLLERFLNFLHSDQAESGKLWNLYITDNESTDDFIPWIRQKDEQYLIDRLYLRNNIGYSAACNMMVSKGSGDIVGLLNGDVWMSSEDVKKIQAIFDNNKDIHILGPKQRDENGHITHAGIIGTNTAPKHRGWREHDPNDVLYKDQIECVTVSGSAYFVRREVWESMTNNKKYQELVPGAIGAFLPTPHYYEETW
jgi:GT2 family glycosyltransferase